MKPYALADGEGRAYVWHDVVFTMKAAAAETGGALALWELTTRPGEEPPRHTHEEDELFYILAGQVTFRCGRRTFTVQKHGFAFLPRGIPHTYTIDSKSARILGMSLPSTFGDHVERTGKRVPHRTTAKDR